MYVVKRLEHNPVLIPDRDHYWEAFATFNMSPVKHGKDIYGLYRAISAKDSLRNPDHISVIGIAKSKDGINFKDRKQFIVPDDVWDRYGCEDPRVTFFEGKYYIFYTALSTYPFTPGGIRVGLAISKDLKKIEEKHLVTPFNAKAMTLFPKRINGKIVVIFSYHTDMPPVKVAIARLDKISDLWNPIFWENWQKEENNFLDLRRNEYDHIEIGASPVETKYGWLLIYSHIQNYFQSSENLDRIFGVEAVLLDINDPNKIIGKTKGPILVPEESYELSGYIPNVVFPSGVLLKNKNLIIYYGSADTTVCCAEVNFDDLIFSILPKYSINLHFKRAEQNPIIVPKPENSWESKATFNPATILLENKIHILYRTLSNDNTSFVGYASSKNGVDIDERLEIPIYSPREDFEMKKIANGNSGCEDPRLTQIGKTIYMCYTAFDSIGPPRVAVSSISEKDFLQKKWNWEKPILITPKGFDDKDTCFFPEKLKGGYLVLHRVGNEICGDYLFSLDFKKEIVKKCIRIIGPRINGWDSAKVGISAPPIKTKHGWLLLYHGVSRSHSTYRVGAVLLDLKDPAIVLARSSDPIFEPEEEYEKVGIVNNVVFPCGMVEKKGILYIYYGGADKVVGVATMKLSILLKALVNGIV
ncbi:MAG: hypothetical protein WCX46_01845 [Candidatus Paceibacterota bacterium]